MIARLWIDLETYSRVDLRKSSPYRYAEDPDFEIMMAAWTTDPEQPVQVALGRDEIDEVPGLWHPKVVKVAHNAPFERICLSAHRGLPVGQYLPIREFHDTQALAGVHGWPQKLKHLAAALGAELKDEAGTALINWFCKPDRNGNRRMPEDHPEKWALFVEYCRQDTVALVDVDRLLPDWPTDMEREIYYADQAVNDAGLRIDVPMARRAVVAVAENRVVLEAELARITGLAKPNNPVTLRQWMIDVGRLRMPNLKAETIEAKIKKLDELGEDGDTSPRYRALELRQELAGTASKKFAAALDAVSSDGRIRGAFRYFGAHTGRWSGRGAQPQNLPREAFMMADPDTGKGVHDIVAESAAILDLSMGLGATPLELKRMVRPMFTGPSVGKDLDLGDVDYSSIEAVVIAWLSGEAWALQAFHEGRDIYVETADRMGGLTRAQGKIAVLALGFAGGVGSLRKMASPKDDFIHSRSDDQIRDELVTPWRKANSRIVSFWYQLEDAFGETGQAGRIHVTHSKDRQGRAVHLHLPSGRAITYHGVRYEHYRVPVDVAIISPKTGKTVTRTIWKEKQGWRYTDPKNPQFRIGTYGGRLAENVTQATARDITGEALVRLVAAGQKVVGHVHDEIMTETQDLHTVERIMVEPPAWADGMPISGDGFMCSRYKKG